jgi:hypothetical protein
VSDNNTIHSRTTVRLQRDFPSAQTRGFRKAIQKLQWDWEKWDQAEEHPTWQDFLEYGEAWKGGIIPDLWFIDDDCMSVICIEVEDTSRINTTKLNQYERLWWHLDEFYWETHLICSDRWGNLTPVPLTDFTSMGLVETRNHPLKGVIEAEREAKMVVFELTKIYAMRDAETREAARRKWLQANPGFGKQEFLHRNPHWQEP